MKVAGVAFGAVVFWVLAYVFARWAPPLSSGQEGMHMLFFFSGLGSFVLSFACVAQLLVWWLIAQRKP